MTNFELDERACDLRDLFGLFAKKEMVPVATEQALRSKPMVTEVLLYQSEQKVGER